PSWWLRDRRWRCRHRPCPWPTRSPPPCGPLPARGGRGCDERVRRRGCRRTAGWHSRVRRRQHRRLRRRGPGVVAGRRSGSCSSSWSGSFRTEKTLPVGEGKVTHTPILGACTSVDKEYEGGCHVRAQVCHLIPMSQSVWRGRSGSDLPVRSWYAYVGDAMRRLNGFWWSVTVLCAVLVPASSAVADVWLDEDFTDGPEVFTRVVHDMEPLGDGHT